MKVVLLESMPNLGHVGDVVNVKRGYARNFLLPQEKAMTASARNVKHMAHQKFILEHKMKRARKTAEEVAKKLGEESVRIRRKAGENEKLFGSVTALDIEEALRAQGVAVDRRSIRLEEPIKKLGQYKVPVKLDGGLEADLAVEVVAETA